MAELAEWSAQALRYQGSDGPVKVMYFRSRLEVTNDSFDQNSAGSKERPELGEQISFKALGASDTPAVLSGHPFNNTVEDPVEVLNSKNYKLQGEEYFEDRARAIGDLVSKFNNFPRFFSLDIESSYGLRYPYTELGLFEPTKEDDLVWSIFKDFATNAKDFEAVQDLEAYRPWERGKRRRGRNQKEKPKKAGGFKKEEDKKKKDKDAEEKKEKTETKENERMKKEEEENKRKKQEEKEQILERRKDISGMTWWNSGRGYPCQCALIFGITTKFNPSGMWIVEDIFYDEEEGE